MGNMEELKQEINSIKEMCLPLEAAIKAELASGIENIDAHEFGEVVDALKDLCKMALMKSQKAYYCSVVQAMEDAEEDGELREKIMDLTSGEEMRFYNDSRYADGRYAPKGRGTRRGYNSYMPLEYGSYDTPYYQQNNRMPTTMYYNGDNGYSGYTNSTDGTSYNMNDARTYGTDNRSTAVDRMQRRESRYDRARRNYTESNEKHNNSTSEDKEVNTANIQRVMKIIDEDLMDLAEPAMPEIREIIRRELNNTASKI